MREHVFPKSQRGTSTGPGDRSPVLWVHTSCEAEGKSRRDALLSLLQQIHTTPANKWDKWQTNKIEKHRATIKGKDGTHYPVLKDVGDANIAVWQWIRGFHAILYGEFVPFQTFGKVLAPSHGFRTKEFEHIEDGLRDYAMGSALIARNLIAASYAKLWDGLTFWGSQVRYRCVWYKPLEDAGAACCWLLEFPAALKWSKNMRDDPVPWRGFYTLPVAPASASLMSHSDTLKSLSEGMKETALDTSGIVVETGGLYLRRVR